MAALKSGYVFVLSAILGISLLVTETHCYQRVRRATPLQTKIYALDHFIELVEKIEDTETQLYLVADYVRSFVSNDEYWRYVIGEPKPLPAGILTDEEKQILTDMVSHRYVGTRELGVVRTSSKETIAIGSVVMGVLAGIYRNKQLSLKEWVSEATKTMDNLYAATIARNLAATALAKKNTPTNEYFGPGGNWDDDECPEKYTKASSTVSEASNAQVLGDTDGFILGSNTTWARYTRLGQLLRMYYSAGICFNTSYASCNRVEKLNRIINEEDLAVQVQGVAEAMFLRNKTTKYPNVRNDNILPISKEVAKAFFPKMEDVSVEHNCTTTEPGCELPANLIFLVDESGSVGSNGFEQEKEFINRIIEEFNISPRQTKVGLIEFGTTAAVDFGLNLYGSKTRLKCAVKATQYQEGNTNTAGAINLARQMLLPLQDDTTSQAKRSNIVILLTDGKSNEPSVTAIYPAIDSLKSQIKELTTIAVGVDRVEMKELRAFASDDTHISTVSNFPQLLALVKKLQNQTCSSSINLGPTFSKDANVTFADFFLTPGKKRFFTLPQNIFFGSSIIIKITPKHGKLRVFASRTHSSPGPDDRSSYDYKIDPIPEGQSLQLVIRDPCSGHNITTCPPLHLGFYAEGIKCTCTEKECFLPGQLKFRLEKGELQPSSAIINAPVQLNFFFLLVISYAVISELFIG